ncbi:MAG: CHAD domain-containing protein [Acidobacteriota bacterium]
MNLRQRLSVSTATLREQLPKLYDGDVDTIDHARATTQRMRAMLAILSSCYPDVDLKGAGRTLKKIGRALGRVRDLGVALEIIGDLERTAPGADGCTADIRRSVVAERAWARCRLANELDELTLEDLEDVSNLAPRPRRDSSRVSNRAYDDPIRDALRERAMALTQAIPRGSALYVPKRAHRLRMDARKLRHILECASDPDTIAPNGLKILKTVQEVLGSLRDRQVLRKRFARRWDHEGGSNVAVVLSTIDADCRSLFAGYVSWRARLLEVCAAIERSTTSTSQRVCSTGIVPKLAGVVVPGLPS